MSRIKELQKRVRKELKDTEDHDKQIAHLHGVSLAASLLAKKRHENAELAAMAGLLHDMYAYTAGTYDDHAHKGAAYARTLLEKTELTNDEETEIICSAIWHHDDKAEADGPLDEILKDADVIDHALSDPTREVKENEKARYEKIRAEFGL